MAREKKLTLSVIGRVTRLTVLFSKTSATVLLPLITRAQKKSSKELLSLFHEYDSEAEIIDGYTETVAIRARLKGSHQEIAGKIRTLFMRTFSVAENRRIRFETVPESVDYELLDKHWEQFYKHGAEAPVAASADLTPGDVKKKKEKNAEQKRGCLTGLAYILLWPIPFVFTYYLFGINAAIYVALAMWAIGLGLKLRKGWTEFKSDKRIYSWLVLPLLAGLSIHQSNVFYFQLIPTVYCVLVLLLGCAASIMGRLPFVPKKHPSNEINIATMSKIALSVLFFIACLIAISWSEYARRSFSMESWVWYYAYLRIEIILLFFVTMSPGIVLLDNEASETNKRKSDET